METLHIKQASQSLGYIAPISRPKLAYVSPLPPERSGISDYSAELLPELARHYMIDVIVAQHSISDPWIQANCQIHSLEWFRTHFDRYDRVLYHFGNSSFHQHMFSLMEEIPGIVVLHDFFLGNLLAHMEGVNYQPNVWTQALYQDHGYSAVQQRFYQLETTVWRYPCNLTALDGAYGVIVHTEHTQLLANKWYGKETADDWAVIPHLRVPALNADRVTARRQLELTDNDFVVCSFGMLGPNKLNHRLLTAWLASTLAKSNNCVLVFVGKNHGGDYGADIITTILNSSLKKRIHITGWANRSTFCHYLAAADIAVQLRSLSRGETSGTVLDCMNYALPTIVNANGSMAELSDDGVWKLPDEFSDAQLIEALETLWHDPFRRQRLGEQAQKIIHTQHVPRHCADKYAQSIENMYRTMHAGVPALTDSLAEIQPAPVDPNAWLLLANAIGQSIPPKLRVRQLFVDISELIQRDVRSGIQRVTRSILHELLSNPPAGYRVEPVYAKSDGKGYRYARNYTLNMLNCSDSHLSNDDVIDFYNGDLFLELDLHFHAVLAHQWFYQQMRNYGVQIYFLVHDLLPIQFPHFWPAQLEINKLCHNRLKVLSETADGAICISRTVANALTKWLNARSLRQRPFRIDWAHLGADIKNSLPSKGIPDTATDVLNTLAFNKNFLMVGTLEPRKRHAQTLTAFEQLWMQGITVNLVIVGKQGWMVETLVEKLRHHPQLGKQLFWLKGISDEYLEKIYDVSSCLIAASEDEGFGLPLIEAAQHKLPIIARNIPIFREIAGDHAYYFNGLEPNDLAQAIQQWLKLDLEHRAPSSEHMPWLTWTESTQQLLAKILPENNKLFRENGMTTEIQLTDKINTKESTIVTTIGKKNYQITSDDNYLNHVGKTFEPYMLRLFDSLTKNDQCMFDVGANIGCVGLFLGQKAKQVYCFEPSPTTYNYLKKNIEASEHKNIICVNVGLGKTTEESELTFSAADRSGGFVSNKISASQGHVIEKISILNGDEFIISQEISGFDFIKIDVEGFEKDVIQGMIKSIKKYHPVVALELNHWCLNVFQRISVPDFLDFLREIFPYLYAVDTNDDVKNLHNTSDAYHVMYAHVVQNFKYPTIIAAFYREQLTHFAETYHINIPS